MKATETELQGAWHIEIEPHRDDRGFFARSFCRREFAELGMNDVVAQCNVSFNERKGTLRGMHYQLPPCAEAKLVRCTAGSIWDAIVDLRPDSPTYLRWTAVELTAERRNALYVPEGFGHGFQTLTDRVEVFYQMSEFYAPGQARGFRWDDPRFGIDWPMEPSCISDADRGLPAFDPEHLGG
jgi:dTDP-4-dehydrorhamnose 3,5-epimerase